jgi:hypothetical protein
MNDIDILVEELSLFSDLGTDAPSVQVLNDKFVVTVVRNGAELELHFHQDGSVKEIEDGDIRNHINYKALLASVNFCNLGKWADSQKILLQKRVAEENIPVVGELSGVGSKGGVALLDESVFVPAVNSEHPQTLVTLVEGPAGIGKTSLLRSLSFRRADKYRQVRRPLVLHVESRGRMLQNLTDLMAFSLQTLRVPVTYDQVPILVKHGLITLVIDGFDELGDPHGYELAWAQINELINSCRGQGSIILAGRETFVGEGRMRVALTSLSPSIDKLKTFSLLPLSSSVATEWLREHGWPAEIFDTAEVKSLFEADSYALRPFFIKELSKEDIWSKISEGAIGDLLSFLIDLMIEREAGKFGTDVENTTSKEQREGFIRAFLEEVARDMAENQTDAISGDTMGWMAEVVAADILPASMIGIVQHRASVVALLTNDDRRGFRRFAHNQILNYFLSAVTIRAISSGEIPKYVRRNIFGLELLENFSVGAKFYTEEAVRRFYFEVQRQLNSLVDTDRSRRNLAALAFSSSAFMPEDVNIAINDIVLDDIFVAETVGKFSLKNVTIAQFFARGADLRSVIFEDFCNIISFIADDATVFGNDLPVPTYIVTPQKNLISPDEKKIGFVQEE